MTQIQISKNHQWDSNLESELGEGGKTTHIDRVQVLNRIVVTLFRPFDRVETEINLHLSWNLLSTSFISFTSE
jgi:hypothetical protein